MVGNRAAQVGDFVQTGQRIAALVPLADVFIDANFKETQLARLQPGQPVSITVDALPDEKIDGVVASFSPASGSVFTLLPPDNATGNFTKIIQRLGVRIRVPADVAERGALRPGMSVVATVNTKPGAVVAAGVHRSGVHRAHANGHELKRRPCHDTPAAADAADRIDPRRLVAFMAMCFGMFMALLDIQIVSASLRISRPASRRRRRNSLGADRLSDRRGGRDPALRLPVTGARDAHAVRGLVRGLYLRELHVRAELVDQHHDRVACDSRASSAAA